MAKKVLSGKDNTNGFQKNPQNINRTGANRKSIATVNVELEAGGYKAASKQDILDCYLRLINIDLKELGTMVKDDEQPAMIRIVGKAILSGKGFDVIEKVLDRGIGKAVQTVDQNNTHTINDFNIKDLLKFDKPE
tara:strand:+ start:3925 stop:4329 length:405 start_codon:yes stop_codon:yes gene_type:complete